jgi:hypothetical protein
MPYGHVSRGLPAPAPSKGPRDSGLGDLRNTVVPSGKAQPDGIPPEYSSTIKALEAAGVEGVEAGAEGLPRNPATQPGSQRSIPQPYRDALISDQTDPVGKGGIHVP